jgi:tetratricopeptide (TPR) repeat protein
MTKLQWTVLGAAMALFLILYFGCETTPSDIAALEKSRVLSAESTDVNTLLSEAKLELESIASSELLLLESQLEEAVDDTARAEAYKSLSSKWYELEYPALAGYYAQQVAEIEGTEDAWSIAGTTFTICIQRSEIQKVRDFCAGRAVSAFESAISLNPDNIAHQVNLALSYTYNPPSDNPMKGVLMLRELNQKAPDNVLVLNTLARLAIRTGQYGRAVERLEQALEKEPDNIATACLLAQAYEGNGDMAKAQTFAAKCREASTTN